MATPGGKFVVRRHRVQPPKTPSTPKLVLAAFQSPATIDFGEQHPQGDAVKTLVLSCPADAKRSATVEVVRTPANVTARFEGGAQSITIEQGDVAACALSWRPERPGGLRGAVAFRLDGKRRLSATVLGKCVEPPPPPLKKATPQDPAKVRGRVEKRLDERARAVAARRASDAVRETTVPDDASLRAWLDELLVGAAPSTGTQLAQEFAAAQSAARRQRCGAVWRSESLVSARKHLGEEVAAARLQLRPELDVRCDQVLRAHVLGLFASVETPWLKAALDVALPLRGKGALRAQLINYLFGDAETAFARDEDNRGRNGKQGGACGAQLGEELRKRCVAHVFGLLHFLDAARLNDALPQRPRLFSASKLVVLEADQPPAPVTSTQQLARAFGRDCLAGEGDILPHLERLGVALTFIQTPLDDYDWRVRDFARDLRDGVRLARAVDVAARSDKLASDVCTHLRVPAASRLPKLHNVTLVLEALQALGAVPPLAKSAASDWARAIVDGRPLLRTRDLVAALAARFSGAARTVDADKLRWDVARLAAAAAWGGDDATALRASQAAATIVIDESSNETKARTALARWAAAVAAGCQTQGLDATSGRCAPGFVKAAVALYHPALACDSDEAAVAALGGVSLDVYAACLDPAATPPDRVAWAFAARLAHRLLASRDALAAAKKLGAFARLTSARKKKRASPKARAASPTVLVFANTPPLRQCKALAPRNEEAPPKPAASKPAAAFDMTPGAIPAPKPPATVRFAAATPAPRRDTVAAAPTPAPTQPTFRTPAPRVAERAQLAPATAAARERGMVHAARAATCVAAAWRRAATRLDLWRTAAATHVQCCWRLTRLRRSSARRRSSGDGGVAKLLAAKLRATKTTSVLLGSLGTLFLQRCGSGAGQLGQERRAARTVQALGRGGLARAAVRERRGAALALQCLVRTAFAFKVAQSPRRDRRARLTFARGAVAVLTHHKAVRDEWRRHTVARVGRLRAYVGARTIQQLARRVAARLVVVKLRVQAWNDLVQEEDDERREAIAAAEARRVHAERAAEVAEARAAAVGAEAVAQARAAEVKAHEIEEKCRAAADEKRREREARIEAAALAATERIEALRVEEENARERAEAEFEARRAAEETAAEDAAAQRLRDLQDAEEAAAARVAAAEEDARARVRAEADEVRLEDERLRAAAAAALRETEAAAAARLEELRASEHAAREGAAAQAAARAADEQRARDEATEKLRRAEAAATARLAELHEAEEAAHERAASDAATRAADEAAESQRHAAELRAAEEAARKRLDALENAEAEACARIEEEGAKRALEARDARDEARAERLRADEATAERLAELTAAEEGARERIEREADRCLGEEAAARDAAAAEIRAASDEAAARLEALGEAEAAAHAERAAAEEAAREQARELAAAEATQQREEVVEVAVSRAAAAPTQPAPKKRSGASDEDVDAEVAELTASPVAFRGYAGKARTARPSAPDAEAAAREKAAADERAREARSRATTEAVARAQRAAAEATAARGRMAAETAARAQAAAADAARSETERRRAEESARVETTNRERRARVDAAKEARRRVDSAARAAAEARARSARSAAEAETRRLRSAEQRLAESSDASEARRAARREEARLDARLQTSRSAIVAEEALTAARVAARRAADAARRGADAMRDADALATLSSTQADARDAAAAEQARLTEEIERKRAEAEAEARRVQEEVALTRAEAKAEARRVQEELATVKQAAADEQAQLAAKLAAARRAADAEAQHLVDSRRESARARAAEARAAADALEAEGRAKRRAEQAVEAERAAAAQRVLDERRRAEEQATLERRALKARQAAERRVEEYAAAEKRAAQRHVLEAEERRAAEEQAVGARRAAERRVEARRAQEAEERRAAEGAAQKLATRRAREAASGAEVVEVAVARRTAVPTQVPPKRRSPAKRSPPKRRQSLGRDRDLPPPSPQPAARKAAKSPRRSRASLGRDLPPPARSDRSPLSPSNRRRPKKSPAPKRAPAETQTTPRPPVTQRAISFESPLPSADAPAMRPTPRPDSRVHREALRRRRLSAATPPQRARKVFDAFDLTEESAAKLIQSRWRCHDACWQFFLGLGAAVEVQRRIRGMLARSPSRSPLRRVRSMPAELAPRAPVRRVASMPAAAVPVVFAVVFPNEGVVVTCQALVRGYRVRAASYRRSPPLRTLRKRLDAAAKKATPSATLGARCRKALALVESGARLEDVRGACAALEASTRLSLSCCEALAASDGALAALLKLARACNRSRPHADLLTLMLRTLANVSETSPALACRVAEIDPCIDVLLDLVQVFRDRPVPFSIATRLLATLAAADVRALNACSSPTATKRLASVAALLKLRDQHEQGAALAAFRQTLATA